VTSDLLLTSPGAPFVCLLTCNCTQVRTSFKFRVCTVVCRVLSLQVALQARKTQVWQAGRQLDKQANRWLSTTSKSMCSSQTWATGWWVGLAAWLGWLVGNTYAHIRYVDKRGARGSLWQSGTKTKPELPTTTSPLSTHSQPQSNSCQINLNPINPQQQRCAHQLVASLRRTKRHQHNKSAVALPFIDERTPDTTVKRQADCQRTPWLPLPQNQKLH
jgi:hypothetical protein